MSKFKKSAEALLSRTGERLRISALIEHHCSELVRRSLNAIQESKARIDETTTRGASAAVSNDKARSSRGSGGILEIAPQKVINLSLSHEVVEMDGKHFIDCIFSNCVLEYSGQPVVLEATRFVGCSFRFKGEAALTMRFCECFDLVATKQEYSIATGQTPSLHRIN